MRAPLAALALLSAVQLASAATTDFQLNGWYPCGLSRAPMTMNATLAAAIATATPFECAEVVVPLCHDGVCKSKKTINVFVRRLLASSAAAAAGGAKVSSSKTSKSATKALWLLEGGPGASSASSTSVALVRGRYRTHTTPETN